jgi:thiamine monophosphate synthase
MNLDLYVITDEGIAKGRTHAEIARLSCEGGADAIQLRDKYSSSENLCGTVREIRAITRRTGTVFIVNDRLDIALACGADGVHLGQDDLKVDLARRRRPGLSLSVFRWEIPEKLWQRKEAERIMLPLARSLPQFRRLTPDRGVGLQ